MRARVKRIRRPPTSTLPIIEPGPGSGGAQTQKSSTEFTESGRLVGTGHMWTRGRTVDILAGGVLTAARATLVRAALSVLGLVGETGGVVGGGIGLSVSAQEGGEEDERKKTEAGGRGMHGGQSEAHGGGSQPRDRTL